MSFESDLLKSLPKAFTFRAGVLASDENTSHEGELTIADLLEIHEFGKGVPERSTIRGFVDEKENEIGAVIFSEIEKGFRAGRAPEMTVKRIALQLETMIQQRITDGIQPDITEETKRRKGSSGILIDTGVLRASHKAEGEVEK